MAKVTSQKTVEGEVTVRFESARPIVRAEFNATPDLGDWPKRNWAAVPASIEGKMVVARLPEGTKVYYVNLFDDRDCVISSEHVEISL